MVGGLERLSSLREAPNTVLALNNEIADFRLVSFELAKHLRDLSTRPDSVDVQILSTDVLPILDRARNRIMELEFLIKYKLILPRKDGSIRLNQAAWIWERQKIKRLRDDVRSTIMSLIAVMGALISKSTLRLELQISALRCISGHLHDDLRRNRVIATASSATTDNLLGQILYAVSQIHSRIDSNIRNTIAGSPVSTSQPLRSQGMTSIQNHRDDEILTGRRLSDSQNLRISSKLQRRDLVCTKSCACRCHHYSDWTSPTWIGPLLGRLFVRCGGLPLLTSSCDQSSCQWKSEPCMSIQYFFPILVCAACYAFSRSRYGGIEHALRLSRTVWAGSKIFWQARLGDADGIRILLASREGSPYDVSSECGATALNVRPTRYSLPLHMV